MIPRYSHQAISNLWNIEAKYQTWWRVELAVLKVLAKQKVVPLSVNDIDQASKQVRIVTDRVSEIEAVTRHDVLAFVEHVSEQMGEVGKWVHYGLTSSDVIDTAFSIQLIDSAKVFQAEAKDVLQAIDDLIDQHGSKWIMGRTHGVNAQPMTLEQKFAMWGAHLGESVLSALDAIQKTSVVKLSGAVGNYPIITPEIEKMVADDLGLTETSLASQVVGRHLHAKVMCDLSVVMGVVEKIAVDIRQHHRTGEGELLEGFAKGQKGSSAMPHKQNPVACENLTGVARLMRAYAMASLENIALWMERDISHSSVERVTFPDGFHLAAYGLKRLASVLKDLQVNEKVLEKHIDDAKNTFYSQILTLRMLPHVKDRNEAYKRVQEASFEAKTKGEDLLKVIGKKHKEVKVDDLRLDIWNQYPGRSRQLFQEIKDRVTNKKI